MDLKAYADAASHVCIVTSFKRKFTLFFVTSSKKKFAVICVVAECAVEPETRTVQRPLTASRKIILHFTLPLEF